MAYTSHGHHIPGTTTENPPETRARCGGPSMCSVCSTEVAASLKEAREPKYVWVVRENSDKTEGRGPIVDVVVCSTEESAYEQNYKVGGTMGVPRHYAGEIYRVELGGYPLVEKKVWGSRRRSWDNVWDYGWIDERDKPNPEDPEYIEYLRLRKKFHPTLEDLDGV